MAEKRKQRQAKQKGQQRPNPFENLPKSKLDFQQSAASKALDTPEKLTDPKEAADKAKELLQNQRDSVDMLTLVRTRIEALPSEDITNGLEQDGYFVFDGLMGNEDILSQLESEATRLYEDGALEVDMGNLGSGEYTVAVKGGQEQYVQCPRTVEWVVSSTKHIPETLPDLSLDPSACMANLRTFDRKAFQASLELLTGSDDVPETTKPFSTVVADPYEDKRRLSLRYYLVPDSWSEDCGGGLRFEKSGPVAAKRDRLVIWKSDSSSMRNEMWKGNDDIQLASCLELHLVGKS